MGSVKKWIVAILFYGAHNVCAGQQLTDSISEQKAREILGFLASDELKGRGNYTPELFRAAKFIDDFFAARQLTKIPPGSYSLPFNSKQRGMKYDLSVKGKKIDHDQFEYLPSSFFPVPGVFEKGHVLQTDGLPDSILLRKIFADTVATVIQVNNITEKHWKKDILFPAISNKAPVLIMKVQESNQEIKIEFVPKLASTVLLNVVGLIPGKQKPAEVIIFSAHYDHLTPEGKKIYNGANDNASGTTALLLLADYYAKKNDNARTLMFCAFSGEELGLYGSEVFAEMLNPKNVIANINIEMIGRSVYKPGNFMLTGGEYSDVYSIFRKNLKPFNLKVLMDTNPGNLFQRSDNFSFVKKGIPAHSIMTSDDNDPCYHSDCDELKRINFSSMIKTIQSIIIASKTLVDGTDTPSRIDTGVTGDN